MLKVGLTGGIGSGKTTVARVFEILGIPVFYADGASKRLYDEDEELQRSIKQHFGEELYSGGVFNREKMASIVFTDPPKLELLNSLVHPRTIADANNWMNRQQAPYVIKEAALIFESGSGADLDYIIGVSAPRHYRIQRVMERDGVNRDAFLQRAARQIDEEIKMKLCDFIVLNNEQQLVIPQVLELHHKLLRRSAELTSTSPVHH